MSTGFKKGKLVAQLLRRIRIQTQIFAFLHLAHCLEVDWDYLAGAGGGGAGGGKGLSRRPTELVLYAGGDQWGAGR